MKKILTFLFIAILLSACSRSAATEEPAAPVLDISDPSKILEAAIGNEFKIIIDSNPTTGYHWEIIGEVEKTIVEFISKDFKGDEPAMPGSGGVDIWAFRAVGAGETHITLGYYPPSNDPVGPQQTVTFTVTVK
ncbi:MAG: protease inhibitor I42 family protein [Chloroflexi bacterium]|nr:protease inhibitor I42 family protein [Chloroflexota bacterium]